MILSHNCGHLLEKAYNKIPLNEFDKIFITDDGSVDNSIEIANFRSRSHNIEQKWLWGECKKRTSLGF